jgi:hypothetical protein
VTSFLPISQTSVFERVAPNRVIDVAHFTWDLARLARFHDDQPFHSSGPKANVLYPIRDRGGPIAGRVC